MCRSRGRLASPGVYPQSSADQLALLQSATGPDLGHNLDALTLMILRPHANQVFDATKIPEVGKRILQTPIKMSAKANGRWFLIGSRISYRHLLYHALSVQDGKNVKTLSDMRQQRFSTKLFATCRRSTTLLLLLTLDFGRTTDVLVQGPHERGPVELDNHIAGSLQLHRACCSLWLLCAISDLG